MPRLSRKWSFDSSSGESPRHSSDVPRSIRLGQAPCQRRCAAGRCPGRPAPGKSAPPAGPAGPCCRGSIASATSAAVIGPPDRRGGRAVADDRAPASPTPGPLRTDRERRLSRRGWMPTATGSMPARRGPHRLRPASREPEGSGAGYRQRCREAKRLATAGAVRARCMEAR